MPTPPPARHNFRHAAERLHDPAAAVLGRWDDVAVVVRQLLISACARQDAPTRDELPIVQQPAKVARPRLAQLLSGLNRGNASRHAIHHLLWARFERLIDVFKVALHNLAIVQLDSDLGQVDCGDGAHLALAGLRIDDHNNDVSHGQRGAGHVFLRITIQENLVAQLVQRVGLFER
jgi:BMFP domain-containing protein YqiC